MKKFIFITPILLLFIFAVGCGGQCKVTGKVTLTDGTPLTHGEVLFESDNMVAKGSINTDGTYRMGTTKPGNGVPKGDYRVYLLATADNKFRGPDGNLYTIEEMNEKRAQWGNVGSPMPIAIPVIQGKYESPHTSGLECKVTGSLVFNIELEPAT